MGTSHTEFLFIHGQTEAELCVREASAENPARMLQLGAQFNSTKKSIKYLSNCFNVRFNGILYFLCCGHIPAARKLINKQTSRSPKVTFDSKKYTIGLKL